jgi:soluble lytic murein transglycosylase-like protein
LAHAGNQAEEQLSASVRSAMQKAVSDSKAPQLYFANPEESKTWLDEMSRRLATYMPDEKKRNDLLTTIHYEALRAGLDPQLVLGIIQIESTFNKYAVSRSGARGYMQVMPFWTELIGSKEHNLFHLRTNLRYGCTILRHYLNIEKGDLARALDRYNGSLGSSYYSKSVITAWQNNWGYSYTAAADASKDTPESALTTITK